METRVDATATTAIPVSGLSFCFCAAAAAAKGLAASVASAAIICAGLLFCFCAAVAAAQAMLAATTAAKDKHKKTVRGLQNFAGPAFFLRENPERTARYGEYSCFIRWIPLEWHC
ncbi:MAG: hypothetical protein ACOYI4_03980 [Christensenellales bacterium]